MVKVFGIGRFNLAKIVEQVLFLGLLAVLLMVFSAPLSGLLFKQKTFLSEPKPQQGLPIKNFGIANKSDIGIGNNKIDISVLTRFNPFEAKEAGKEILKKPLEIQVEIQAPETSLNLRVFGMRTDLAGGSSSAIIQTADGKQRTYYIGDEIMPGVSLHHVDIDYVILQTSAGLERLSRQGKEQNKTDDGLPKARTNQQNSQKTAAIRQVLAGQSAQAMEIVPSSDAAEFVKNIRMVPAYKGRKKLGFRIVSKRTKSLAKYGFMPNDIITSVNGHNLTDNQVNIPEILNTLKSARYISFQIIRNGAPASVELVLQ